MAHIHFEGDAGSGRVESHDWDADTYGDMWDAAGLVAYAFDANRYAGWAYVQQTPGATGVRVGVRGRIIATYYISRDSGACAVCADIDAGWRTSGASYSVSAMGDFHAGEWVVR